MSRTELDATTLANSLRAKAGDGSVEWVMEPIQSSVLLDIADMLDENAKLRKRITEIELDNNQLSFTNDVYLKFAQLVSDDNDHLQELCANRIECSETHLAERHLPWDDDDEYWLYCDECGYFLYMRKAFVRPRYCSHCGRKAVEE